MAARKSWPRRRAACARARCSSARWATCAGWPTSCSGANLSFDLADLRGYAYYTGVRFSLFAGQAGRLQELVRGGRYDEVGGVFGRRRPAVGFSLDLKTLVSLAPATGAAGRDPGPLGPGAGPARRHCRSACSGRNRGLRPAGPRA